MQAIAIIKSVGDKLEAQGLKRDLSPQAVAVIAALVEAINESESKPLVLVRQATVSGRMRKPELSEVQLHAAKIGLPNEEALKFYDFYESKGWKVGAEPMKLWTAALANWKRTWQGNGRVSSNVEAIKNQTALVRVEDRMKAIRGQFPLAATDPKRAELEMLKAECGRLKQLLEFKA